MSQQLIFLESENQAMTQRVAELEIQFSQVGKFYKHMRDENKIAEGLSKAINFNQRFICLKYFKEFRLNIRASRHIRVFLKFKELRRIRFLKMLTFLYLKQEFVICKHI